MKTEEELLDLKKTIDEAKPTVSELTGQQKTLMAQLKEEWKCPSTEASNKKITAFLTQLKDIDQQISDKSTELETKYEL